MGGNVVRDAEMVPELAVIVHGWFIKWGLVKVKEIVGGYGFLNLLI